MIIKNLISLQVKIIKYRNMYCVLIIIRIIT